MEAMSARENSNKEIKKIVKDLSYLGIDPFRPRMI